MQHDSFVRGAAVGFFAGTVVSALIFKGFVNRWVEIDKRIAERNKAIFNHMIRTMGPHVPPEVLEENLTFMQFQSIVTHEEGLS